LILLKIKAHNKATGKTRP